tara:strand:- start:219 stop:767 length:549 start_codon:yes stop_codon:yes gene_type:complete
MIIFLQNNNLNLLIPELRHHGAYSPHFSGVNYKHMYYNITNTTSSSTDKTQIKTELQQYGIKEGILKLDIVHKVCNLFPKNIKIKTLSFVKINPNKKIDKHVDNKKNRSTVLSIPLAPNFSKYKPVTFYDFETNWIDLPFLMPTEKLHSVDNNEYTRVNFQIGFEYSIDTMNNYYKNGQLFL